MKQYLVRKHGSFSVRLTELKQLFSVIYTKIPQSMTDFPKLCDTVGILMFSNGEYM